MGTNILKGFGRMVRDFVCFFMIVVCDSEELRRVYNICNKHIGILIIFTFLYRGWYINGYIFISLK